MNNKYRFSVIVLVIAFIILSLATTANETKYEHDDNYVKNMPHIWMAFDYEGAAEDITADYSPNGIELSDSEDGVIVSMTGVINDQMSDPYMYFPLMHDKLSDVICEESLAISFVIKTDVAIKVPETVNQPELYFRTVQDPTFVRVGHSDWTEHFENDVKWASGTEGYKATEEWQVLTFDMSEHSFWTSVPDRLRLDLFDACQNVTYVIKGIAFFSNVDKALAWDGDFDRVTFEEDYLKSIEPTEGPTSEPTATPAPTEEVKTTKEPVSGDEKTNYTWVYIVIPVVIVAAVVLFFVYKKKKQ